ncbi:3-hydroxyacyl-thioester dehydratase HtdY [Acrocarpospora pleiomorpha]|uniref:3-hydroxyacyl-thioester dehydratase HtdY n=1 Tax=Acrocarpospora pleiomorpha TaxID=90975 RepID=A0A5M3XUE8_9ACTN|nr:MaoC/PaaZ C-terminal domain-containing protein [Acrocarpospora pleiomorpha]GES22018.1 3-hydroxyacyl-thioester dehydratase HtdY [Acrocarpospora pleiomorpha]
MPLDPGYIGSTVGPFTTEWTARETLLYALAVGAGAQDPGAELQFTTEHSAGFAQQVIPSFAVLLGHHGGLPEIGTYDQGRAVHAEQHFQLERPLPPAGRAVSTVTVTDMWDKGRDALVWTETRTADAETGEPLAVARSCAYLGGAGGFGGERGPRTEWSPPDREPDAVIRLATRPDQALLYRLTGDRNPLHSDPAFAARYGFARPILHGLCTYGFTARAIVNELCAGDASRLRGMSGRFSRPVLPGETLSVALWRDGAEVSFLTSADGGTVIDRGGAVLTGP